MSLVSNHIKNYPFTLNLVIVGNNDRQFVSKLIKEFTHISRWEIFSETKDRWSDLQNVYNVYNVYTEDLTRFTSICNEGNLGIIVDKPSTTLINHIKKIYVNRLKICLFIICDKLEQVPPSIRSNVNLVFMMNNIPLYTLKNIYDTYIDDGDFELFSKMYKNNSTLVYDSETLNYQQLAGGLSLE